MDYPDFLRGRGIYILLLVLAALHFLAIFFPSNSSVFDEYYYIPASKDLLNLTASNIEHPFFGKVWGALGILIFGDNFLGWRFFYVLIGLASVFAFYRLARRFMGEELSLLASSLLGFENVFFMHTSLLLLEGPCILFALLSFNSYMERRYNISALFMGLSVLSKEWGVYFAFALLLFHLYSNRKRILSSRLGDLGRALAFVLIAALTFSIPMWTYDQVYHPYAYLPVVARPAYTQVVGVTGITIGPHSTVTAGVNVSLPQTNTTKSYRFNITNPIQNWEYYFIYQSSLVGCSSGEWNCYPWLWVLPYSNISPLPYYVSYSQTDRGYTPIAWVGIGNLVLWYSIWPVLVAIAVRAYRRHFSSADALVLSLLAGTYLPAFVLSLLFRRVLYSFYMINVDPALALGVALLAGYIAGGKNARFLSVAWLLDALAFFALFYPVHATALLYRGPLPSAYLLAPVMLLFVFLFAYSTLGVIGFPRYALASALCSVATLASLLLLLSLPNSISALTSNQLLLSSFTVMVGEFLTALIAASSISYRIIASSIISRKGMHG